MVDKTKVEKILAQVMDEVPSIEGLIAAKTNGEVLAGQIITSVSKEVQEEFIKALLNGAKHLASAIKVVDKGELQDFLINTKKGSILLVGAADVVITAIVGVDGRANIALIKKTLTTVLKQIVK